MPLDFQNSGDLEPKSSENLRPIPEKGIPIKNNTKYPIYKPKVFFFFIKNETKERDY